MSTSDPKQVYEQFLKLLSPSSRHRSATEISDGLKRIRRLVLVEGIPDGEALGLPNLRGRIWKLLLNIHHLPSHTLDSEEYLRLVNLGPSAFSDKIKNDTFRTLATDATFKGKVREDMLVRLLECFVWRNSEKSEQKDGVSFTYVQGMNVLSAPFLYTLPTQLEAFQTFSAFMEGCCPLYVQRDLRGVHRGLKLLDRCLLAVDPELYDHLRSKNLSAELYAFPSVLTLCACTPPLDQVLRLWDFLLAFGVHLNILCVIAQLLIIRQELMDSPSPMKILRIFPPLDAPTVIGITVALVKDVPEDLYGELVRHPFAA